MSKEDFVQTEHAEMASEIVAAYVRHKSVPAAANLGKPEAAEAPAESLRACLIF